MNSFQESKNELEAAIRYAENAISSAQSTIESMEFRQEMAKKQYAEQTGREEELTKLVKELEEANEKLVVDNHNLESKVQGQYDDIVMLEREVEFYTKKYNELVQQKEASSGPCGCQAYRDLEEKVGDLEYAVDALDQANSVISEMRKREKELNSKVAQLERDLTVKTAQAGAWKKEVDNLKAEVNALEQPERPTMPVIPKDVAIAIFREGVQHGVEAACTEIDMDTYIRIEESEYVGDFHVTFERDIDLNDHIDTDWMRGKCGDYDEKSVIEALKNLCADKEFECRIHGIDDNE